MDWLHSGKRCDVDDAIGFVDQVRRVRDKELPLIPSPWRSTSRFMPMKARLRSGSNGPSALAKTSSEKLDYTPGVFTVQRHIRGKWACGQCETLTQATAPPHVIDKGIPTAGLLAHTLVFKFGDHLPLYRQERIYARAGLAIPQSTLGAWVGICGVDRARGAGRRTRTTLGSATAAGQSNPGRTASLA